MTHSSTAFNPHATQPTSLVAQGQSLWRNRQLIVQMTRRDVVGRYKGSVMGLAWSLFLMLVVYTFAFSVIFKSRWGGGGGDDSKTQFTLLLFVGMIVMSLFSDVLNRAPSLIPDNVNYAKKVVFPLEILPVIAVGVSLFHSLIGLGVLLIAFVISNDHLHWTLVFTPPSTAAYGHPHRGSGLDTGILGCISQGRWTIHRDHYHRFDVPSSSFFPITAVPERFLARHHGETAHVHHRASARGVEMGPFVGLVRFRHIYHRGYRKCLGWLCLVPKNTQGVC